LEAPFFQVFIDLDIDGGIFSGIASLKQRFGITSGFWFIYL